MDKFPFIKERYGISCFLQERRALDWNGWLYHIWTCHMELVLCFVLVLWQETEKKPVWSFSHRPAVPLYSSIT